MTPQERYEARRTCCKCGEAEPEYQAWEMDRDSNGDDWCIPCQDKLAREAGKNIHGEDVQRSMPLDKAQVHLLKASNWLTTGAIELARQEIDSALDCIREAKKGEKQ